MENPIKFRLISTGRYVFAELDGKTIGPGITDLHFKAKDENGNLRNKLTIEVDLDKFEFLPDGDIDEKYKKYLTATTEMIAVDKN